MVAVSRDPDRHIRWLACLPSEGGQPDLFLTRDGVDHVLLDFAHLCCNRPQAPADSTVRIWTSITSEQATSHASSAANDTMSGSPPAARIPEGAKKEIQATTWRAAADAATRPNQLGNVFVL